MHVEVKSDHVRVVKTNNGTQLQKQEMALVTGGDFPLRFEATVDVPLKPGRYTLSASSFKVGRFGGLEVDPYNMGFEPVRG